MARPTNTESFPVPSLGVHIGAKNDLCTDSSFIFIIFLGKDKIKMVAIISLLNILYLQINKHIFFIIKTISEDVI